MNGSIRKRGKQSWELTIDLGRDAGGQRRRKFVNVKGKRSDADRIMREMQVAIDKGIPINTEKMTLADWLHRWMADYVTPTTRQMTQERYERIIDKYIKPVLGQIKLTKLAPTDIRAFEAKLSTQGMAPAGVQLVHAVLSGALKYALRMEVISRNPVQAVTPPKIEREEVEPPDIAGVRRMLELAKAEKHPLFPCLHLIAYTGVRRGEALGLRWEDTDLETGTILISQSLGRSVQKGLIFQPPKTNSGRRAIDLDNSTVEVLRAHQGQQLLQRLELEGAYLDNNLVFPGSLGEPMNPMAVTRACHSLAKRVGLKEAKVHSLRHFHASVMLQQGQSMVLVSKRLGHSSVSMTADVYAHLLPGWQKEAANAFAKVMRDA